MNRTALITGASSGIGASFARVLAARGYDLILVARRLDRLTALAGECREKYSVTAETFAADLANPDDVARLEEKVRTLPTLDVLVNNAGFGTTGFFADVDLVKHLDMVRVHLSATLGLTHAALQEMRARRAGNIINVSSLSAYLAMPNAVTYCATKMALITFSEALAKELAGTGVRVQALCPGFTYTEFHDTPEFKKFSRSDVSARLWMPADAVVEESLNALGNGRVVCIPGRANRILMMLHKSPLGPLLVWALARKRYELKK